MKETLFEWAGGDPALDLVNTLDERPSAQPMELLPSYHELLSFTGELGLVERASLKNLEQTATTATAKKVLGQTIKLREVLNKVLLSIWESQKLAPELLADLQTDIEEAHQKRELKPSKGSFSWQWKDPNDAHRPLWELALATERLLLSGDLVRVKQCAAHDCGVWFIDKSRAGRRRWCSMANCGNRAKVRRFRAVRRDDGN